MNILFKLLLFFSCVSTLFSNTITLNSKEKEFLNKHSVITLGSDSNWAPFVIKSDEGNILGYDRDILNLVNKKTGANFQLITGKWKNILQKAKNKEIDGLSTSAVHKSRENIFNFSNTYISTQRLLLTSVINPKKISSVDDLEGMTIGYQASNLFDKKIVNRYKKSTLIPYSSLEEVLDALINGKIDATIGSHAILYLSNKKELPFIKVVNKIPNSSLNMVFSLRKDYPEDLSILNKGLEAITKDEKIKLLNKWFFYTEKYGAYLEKIEKDKSSLDFTLLEESYLNSKKNIKMCVLPNWLPFEQIDENQKHKGIGSDLIKLISQKTQKDFVLVPTDNWAESLKNIRERKCDILPIAMDVPSRRDAMNFTRPYAAEPFVIATKSDKFFIKDSSEIGNRKIGIVRSYAFIEVLKKRNPQIKIIEVKDAKEGLEKVRSGELFGYVDVVSAIIYTIQENSMPDLKIAGKLEFDIKLSIASRNDEPLLNSIMQKSLNEIGEKQIRSIVSKWLSIKIENGVDYDLLWKVSLAFLFILLIALYKNREISKLNKKLILANDEILNQQLMVDKYVMLITTDLKGIITSANEAFCNKLGFKKSELIGKSHEVIQHPHMSEEFFKDLWSCIEENKPWTGEIQNLTKDKKTLYFNVIIEPLFKEGKKIGYRSISEDITDKKRIEVISITDKLTGLNNRLKIDEILLEQAKIFKRYGTVFSVILLDIDNFKKINDNYGHDIGDIVLKEFSLILKTKIRETDISGRWGGEEFLIICPNTKLEQASILAEKIRKIIASTSFSNVNQVTSSFGVSTYTNEDSLNSLFKRVDTALYKAKNNGKNRTISL